MLLKTGLCPVRHIFEIRFQLFFAAAETDDLKKHISRPCTSVCVSCPRLPDCSWYNIPKREKYIPNDLKMN
jgi:hypothetical protein